MAAVCKLARLPRNPINGAEICDKYGNRWKFASEQNGWISHGMVYAPSVVTESADGLVSPEILDQLTKVGVFVNSGIDLRPLKLLPGRDAYWYYFRSSDKLIKFSPEAEDSLRIEVDRGRLFQILAKQACAGPRGERGSIGDKGRPGKPGPAEAYFEPNIDGNRLDFAIYTPAPLSNDRTDISLPNKHVPDISVRILMVSTQQNGAVRQLKTGDQLQYLAAYFHGLNEAVDFQRTRELFTQFNMGTIRDAVCDQPLSKVIVSPLAEFVDQVPVVTVLVDPLGKIRPRIVYDRRFPVDVNKSVSSISYDQDTNVVCGSLYLQNAGVWIENLCVKSRQCGPDGTQGLPGERAVRVVECSLDPVSVFATCPIITARLDCERQTILTTCADVINQVCVENVKLGATAGTLNDRSALNTSFAAAQMVLDDCKLIERYEVELVEDEFDDLVLTHWEPQPGCVTRRHYDRHKFNWVKTTDIPACDEVAKWYGPNGLVRGGKYPWYIGQGRPPAANECCQEDFFYLPNIQVGCSGTAP